MTRYVAVFFAWLFLLLAVIGIALPGLPTVPFLLLAAWFASRGSPRLHRWLLEHPRFGKALRDWESEGAVSRRSKVLAVLMLAISWIVMYRTVSTPVLLGVSLLFAGVATFLLSRPEPR